MIRIFNLKERMAAATEERFVFHVEWFDQVASLVRRYQLTFFPSDDSIEMVGLARAHSLSTISR